MRPIGSWTASSKGSRRSIERPTRAGTCSTRWPHGFCRGWSTSCTASIRTILRRIRSWSSIGRSPARSSKANLCSFEIDRHDRIEAVHAVDDLVDQVARVVLGAPGDPHDLRLNAELREELVDLGQLPREALAQAAQPFDARQPR